MKQFEETLSLYRAEADDWQRKSANVKGEFSTIHERNRAALKALATIPNAKNFLDVGCGTGQLVVAAAQQGAIATGIDFSPEMILHCEDNRNAAGVAATFHCGSFFDIALADGSFDVVSAMGFIEYFSPEEMTEFFRRAHRLLRPGGALVVGSRNRLFNLFSYNAYTQLEMDLGTVNTLIAECMVLQTSATQEEAFAALRRIERLDPQPTQHPSTGVPVARRPQYSPADLSLRLREIGFEAKKLLPVHFHGLPVALVKNHRDLHNTIAQTVSDLFETDHRVIPQCSTYVIEARKI